jgi:hypothetical protein
MTIIITRSFASNFRVSLSCYRLAVFHGQQASYFYVSLFVKSGCLCEYHGNRIKNNPAQFTIFFLHNKIMFSFDFRFDSSGSIKNFLIFCCWFKWSGILWLNMNKYFYMLLRKKAIAKVVIKNTKPTFIRVNSGEFNFAFRDREVSKILENYTIAIILLVLIA